MQRVNAIERKASTMRNFFTVVIFVAANFLISGTAFAQSTVSCQSRNFAHQFCPTDEDVRSARLISQDSRSPCIEGQTWGFSRRGVWVNNGCSGRFRVDGFRPPPWNGGGGGGGGGGQVSCDSDAFRYQFCGTNGPVMSAELVRQRSRSACVQGRSWGWRSDGIWVSEGCQGDFRIQTGFRPIPPPGPGLTVCESLEYRYNFCGTGRIRDAQLVNQRSRSPCIRNRTWGVQSNGIWVDSGCQATFRVF
jgi:hypothetical protein